MKKFNSFLLCAIFAGISIHLHAHQWNSNHLIVALDARSNLQSPSLWEMNKHTVRNNIPNLLSKYGLAEGIVSTLTFSLDTNNSNMRQYTHAVTKGTIYRDFNIIQNEWDKLCETYQAGSRFSLVSIAKPYSLKAMMIDSNSYQDEDLTYRTYLMLITDGHYNGNDDYYGELDYAGYAKKTEILNEVKNIYQNYFYEYKDKVRLGRGYILLFECIPLQKYYSIESTVDFPHELIARRTKKGYTVDVPIKSFENKNYQLLKSEFSLGEEKQILNGYGTISFNDISEDDWLDNDFTYIQMKSWVRFLDDIYNRTILNPDGDEEQGALGLNRKILLVKEKNAKIWGIIPLCDNMFKMSFWTNNQYVAAGVWGFLFAIIVLLFILWGVKRTLNYNQKNGGYKG